jgi:hypothetical protein
MSFTTSVCLSGKLSKYDIPKQNNDGLTMVDPMNNDSLTMVDPMG